MNRATLSLLLATGLLSLSRADNPAPPSHPAPPAMATLALTGEDMQELRTARAAALQANPDLLRKMQELRMRMMAFQEKLKAAMLKSDPQIAATLDKLDPRQLRPQPAPMVPPK